MAIYGEENMNYIVIELQTTGGVTSHIVTSHATLNEAKSKYHLVLSAAAVSQVEIHAAAILDQNGFELVSEVFTHEPEPESEGE